MPETAAALAQALPQQLRHHRRCQLQRAGLRYCFPVGQGGMNALQLPGPLPAFGEQGVEQLPQARDPFRRCSRFPEPAQLLQQGPQQGDPALLLLEAALHRQRGTVAGSQARLLWQHQAKHEAIKGPLQAVAVVAAPIRAIEPPAEAGLLQHPADRSGIVSAESLGFEQGRARQQPLQG